ncbi:MAG: tyrosine--tRNA ligase [Planctomycetota bacterium]
MSTERRTTPDLLDELAWRGLLHQCTDETALRRHLDLGQGGGRRRIYAGFDPTADSLTIGNLVPIMLLRHVQRAGHEPIVVMGGGTGLIGDPSGKSAERQLMTADTVAEHISKQRPIFESLLGDGVKVRDNAEWLAGLGYIEALRDIGKHFSVNMMMQKDSVRSRLQDRDQGISYTEFSYMILQAYDFAYLFEKEGVTAQCGGSDQYGNMVAGSDLIRRRQFASSDHEAEAFAFTAPLMTKADGGKFGKTESGAIWLTRERTSPYAYFQFWLNTADADVGRFLRTFTLLPQEDIDRLERSAAENPGAREAQRTLAREATTLLHGAAESEAAEAAGRALFSGDIAGLSAELLEEVLSGAPASAYARDRLAAGVDLIDVLIETGLAKSKREAKQFIANGSVLVNGQRAEDGRSLTTDDLVHGSVIALRRGKKQWHVTRWSV